jgi:hypothetical protein
MGGTTYTLLSNYAVMEKEDWKPFRNAMDKSDRKKFDGGYRRR